MSCGHTEYYEDNEQDDGTTWRVCWDCQGERFVDHDCGEDCCVCLDPEPNVLCDTCMGEGGWSLDAEEARKTALRHDGRPPATKQEGVKEGDHP